MDTVAQRRGENYWKSGGPGPRIMAADTLEGVGLTSGLPPIYPVVIGRQDAVSGHRGTCTRNLHNPKPVSLGRWPKLFSRLDRDHSCLSKPANHSNIRIDLGSNLPPQSVSAFSPD